MKKMGMLFEEEDNVAGHLGVLIDRDEDKCLTTLRQGGLAKRIVETFIWTTTVHLQPQLVTQLKVISLLTRLESPPWDSATVPP